MANWVPMDIPPGCVKTKSGETAVGRWVDALNVRFRAGKPRKRAGFERLSLTQMLGKARGMKAWNKINGKGLYSVGTHLKLYGSTDGIDVTNITPLRAIHSWINSLATTINNGAVTVHMVAHGYSLGQLFSIYGNSYKGGSQVGGLILNGTWALVEVTDADNFKLYPTSAQGTLGASPFATTNTSTTVAVTHVSHGRVTGDTVWFSGASAVGGITIAGDYQITVVNGNSYTITHSAPATSTTTGGGTVGYKYGLPATSTVASSGGTVPYNLKLTNPFQVTNLSTDVIVTVPGHGAVAGDTVHISGATAVGGITIAGDYLVGTSTLTTFHITHTAAANASTTGGGTAVLVEFEISPGPENKITSHRGFGEGPLGAGPFGVSESASSSTYFDPRTWSIDHVGEDAVMNPLGGAVYYWDSSSGGRAELIPEAPMSVRYTFMTEERHLHCLGADDDPMAIRWDSQDDLSTWTASSTNTANTRRVREGSSLIAGCPVEGGLNLIWTDTTAYAHQYTGTKYVYDTRVAALESGLISPHAFARTPLGIVWMSQTRFKLYAGSVIDIPNQGDVSTWVYDNLDPNQLSKAFALYDGINNSVDFYFVPMGGSEPSWYVTVCLDDMSWVPGVETRTTGGAFQKGQANPLKVNNGWVYKHEVGHDADGASAPSSITLAPFQVQEQFSEFNGFDPDFTNLVGQMQINLTSYDHDENEVVDIETETLTPGDEIVDFRSSGRHISLEFSHDVLGGSWALGTPKMDIKAPRGRKR
jgi:hypothetical protein